MWMGTRGRRLDREVGGLLARLKPATPSLSREADTNRVAWKIGVEAIDLFASAIIL